MEKIYVVLETTASNDGVVTKALKAFKTKEKTCLFIDEQDVDESKQSPSVSLLDYQEIELEG